MYFFFFCKLYAKEEIFHTLKVTTINDSFMLFASTFRIPSRNVAGLAAKHFALPLNHIHNLYKRDFVNPQVSVISEENPCFDR